MYALAVILDSVNNLSLTVVALHSQTTFPLHSDGKGLVSLLKKFTQNSCKEGLVTQSNGTLQKAMGHF